MPHLVVHNGQVETAFPELRQTRLTAGRRFDLVPIIYEQPPDGVTDERRVVYDKNSRQSGFKLRVDEEP